MLAACAAPAPQQPGSSPEKAGQGAASTPAAGTSPAPSASTPAAQANPDATLTIAVSRNLVDGEQNPWYVHSSLMVWESLIALDDELKPTPQLAEDWEQSPDGLSWTFRLRPDVRFTDGTAFDADAVVANVERYQRISPRPSPFFTLNAQAAFGDLVQISKVDDQTVAFHHRTPYPVLEATMSGFFSAMFSPKSFAENGDFRGIPAATGPFRLVDWKRDQYALLDRNDGYRGTRPRVRQVRARIIPDANTRVSALLAGEVDALVELGALLPAQAAQLRDRPGIHVAADPISISQYLAFNCSKPPFSDVRLRQAVALAVDRDTIVRDLVLGFATPGQSLLSPFGKRWFSTKGSPRYAPAEAASLARQALSGGRVGVRLPFSVSPGQARPYKETAELLQALLRPLGIDLQLQALETAALSDTVNRGEWDLRFSQQGWANGDPDFIFSAFLHSRGGYNTTNKAGYHNDEVDRLIEAGRAERDVSQRFAIYERLQEIAAAEVPVLPLYHEHSPYAYSDGITGLRQRITYQPTLETVAVHA